MIFSSPEKIASYGNCWNILPLKMVALFSCPVMHRACMKLDQYGEK